MNITISKKLLVDGLNKVRKAISSRVAIPALSGVLIEAKNDHLILTGSDSNILIRETIEDEDLDIIQEGRLLLPAREFSSIVKSLPEEEVKISVEDNATIIKSGKAKFTLNNMNAGEYPRVQLNNEETFSIEKDLLAKLFDKTTFATSEMETRPILSGVNLTVQDGSLKVVATDSHRLSRIVTATEINEEIEVTIPKEGARVISSLFDEGELSISIRDNIVIQDDKTYLMIRLLEGQFPETDRLIPTDFTTELVLNKASFLESLERATILSEDQVVKLDISDENRGIFDNIILEQRASEVGGSKENIIVDEVEGDDLTVSFNARYVIEALRAINEETVKLSFSGQLRPFTLTGVDAELYNVQLILPVRTF